MTTTITLTTEDYQALLGEQQRLAHQLRLMTVERDLLKERLDAFLHRLFAARSEARANPAQRDLFLNEAEALAPQGAPIAEEVTLKGGHERRIDLVLYVNGIAAGSRAVAVFHREPVQVTVSARLADIVAVVGRDTG